MRRHFNDFIFSDRFKQKGDDAFLMVDSEDLFVC